MVPLIVETYGGLGHRGRKLLGHCAVVSVDKKRGRDGTRYSTIRPAPFFKHHLRAIASAVVMQDARDTLVQMRKMKQRAFELACLAAASAAGPARRA